MDADHAPSPDAADADAELEVGDPPGADLGDDVPRYSIAEYVALEAYANLKHEYDDGVIRAMSGGTLEHARLASSANFEITRLLREAKRPCVVLTSDARVHVESANVITYPDLSIVCGPSLSGTADRLALLNPLVLVEITSPSSERYDRGRKFARYRELPSLQAYVIVSHRRRRIDVFGRPAAGAALPDGLWPLVARGEAGGRVAIAALGIELAVDAVYDDPRDVQSDGAPPSPADDLA